MAQLPDGTYIVNTAGDGDVIIFNRYTEEVLVQFNPTDANETAQAQKRIHDLKELSPEDKVFAHFWSGYFYAYSAPYHGRGGG